MFISLHPGKLQNNCGKFMSVLIIFTRDAASWNFKKDKIFMNSRIDGRL